MNEFDKETFKKMAFTALDNDVEISKNHRGNHHNRWQHPDCVHCQIGADKKIIRIQDL